MHNSFKHEMGQYMAKDSWNWILLVHHCGHFLKKEVAQNVKKLLSYEKYRLAVTVTEVC